MDKVAYYEEMILDDVLEKEAGAMNRFMRNVADAELMTGLKAKFPRLEQHTHGETEYSNRLKANAVGYGTKPRMIKSIKDDLGWTPYKGNTGLANGGRNSAPLTSAIKRNRQLQYAKKQQGVIDSLKAKSPNIKSVQFE